MPARLLPLLTDVPVSGERLARTLGVGRVSVNSFARALQEEGFPVVVSRRGYALEAGSPAPSLLDLGGRPYRYVGTTGSTQDDVRAWAADAQDPAVPGAVVLAERQTSGRGRRGRVWEGPGEAAGRNLTFSMLLPAPVDVARLALLPLAAGVALARTTQALAGVGGLKWPNDLLDPRGRKLAGILLEADVRGEDVTRAVLGIGLNVGSAPVTTQAGGSACLQEFAPDVRRSDVLTVLLPALDRWLAAPGEAILEAWRAASVTLGQPVTVSTAGGVLSGVARELAPDGALVVVAGDGSVHRVTAGDVQLVGRLQ
ncbi:biotin--[acetyl-CoA-carboxylase] ligase [Deinococcus aquiradiocola]|uniref:biotin--[acetyl-CoA-carboxylase] ligase n=1 Tax=Deinococcus aquiradiocola TaxID=393059 RepID=UPI0016644E74|nr:biotin--[acetyl-CoA-carboxylase] ligase [Deinococcus aquiradiocola]